MVIQGSRQRATVSFPVMGSGGQAVVVATPLEVPRELEDQTSCRGDRRPLRPGHRWSAYCYANESGELDGPLQAREEGALPPVAVGERKPLRFCPCGTQGGSLASASASSRVDWLSIWACFSLMPA